MHSERVRLSDPQIPPLTADSVTKPSTHADIFLQTPIRSEFDDEETTLHWDADWSPSRRSDPKQFRGFERPSFARIATLSVLCLIAYPMFYILKLLARDKPLFTVRLIVAVWCSGVGWALGYILLDIGIRHIEAATWATLIHMSYDESRMKLGVLARHSEDPRSWLSALQLLLSRFWRRAETARNSRGSYDKRPWSLFIGFFVVLVLLGSTLPFLFGRIMCIEIFVRNQHLVYREVLIAGDLSRGDVEMATRQLSAFQSFAQTWTLLPYGKTPPNYVEFAYFNDTVYFPQPSLSQFIPGGSGLGSFNVNQTALPKDSPNNTLAVTNANAPINGMGVVLRYPQWGIRIHCEKLPDPNVNLIPISNHLFTYAFLPQDLLRRLFAGFGMDLPPSLTKPDLQLLDPNDTIPTNIDSSKISYLVKWWGNGVAHSFHSRTIVDTSATSDQAWTTVETVIIRLNTSFTPSGRFPVYSNNSVRGASRIGYDAAVCVERFEPWIIEAYNISFGSPSTLRIFEKGYRNASLPSGKIRGDPIQSTRYLNTTGKDPAFFVAHYNSVDQMVKDNGRDFSYVPSPTAVSFTDGAGPEGYTELSSDRFAVVRARFDAVNVLPYLAGSAPVVAKSYPDEALAYVTYAHWQLIGLLMLVMILGITGELFVPTLPLNIARRGFEVYSWLAFFQAQEVRFEVDRDLDKMSREELEEKFCNMEVKFVI